MANEGGGQYVDRPGDSGGPTRWGVSLKFYRQFKKNQALDSDAIKALTKDDAKAIAHSEFWLPLRLDFANDKRVATAIFDQAYLNGVPKCATFAQTAIKTMAPYIVIDGILGPRFWDACNRGPSSMFLASFTSLLNNSFEDLVLSKPQFKPFLDGWLNRVAKINTIV